MQVEPIAHGISTIIARVSRRVVEIASLQPVSGGSLQPVSGGPIPAFIATTGKGATFFVKVGTPEQGARLRAEARGLLALRATATVRVPELWLVGGESRHYFLMIEHLQLGAGDAQAHAALGRQVAALHGCTGESYGFERDNFIGATPQANTPSAHWPAFWREQRLLPQLALAQRPSGTRPWGDTGLQLAERLDGFFAGYTPQASLLHGDLWPGNAGFLPDGTPVLYDPAAYYGDREAEMAMTEMFGGLPPAFHAAYHEAWPLEAGYATRKGLYKLYHLLNHYNLFGESYAEAVQSQIASLLATVK